MMHAVLTHWSYDPFLIVVLVVAAVHARGLRARLRAISRAHRPVRSWWGQAVLFYLGLLTLLVAVLSPIDYWSDYYLSVHMVQHLLLAFVAPPLIVLGAPWLPILRGLPRDVRRALGRLAQRTSAPTRTAPELASAPPGWSAGWRALATLRRGAAWPWTWVIAFNAMMVLWHVPVVYDLALNNQTVHVWGEHGSFFGLGIALWLQVFGSYPLRPALPGYQRVVVLFLTNAVMVGVAMTLVLFTHVLYSYYLHLPGHTFAGVEADQQIAGTILWGCGEVSLGPAVYHSLHAWLRSNERSSVTVLSDPTGPHSGWSSLRAWTR